MSGYSDRSEPFGREPRPSLGDWVTLGTAVLMALAMLASSIAEKTGAAPWFPKLGVAPVGIAEIVFAGVFLGRALTNSRAERFSPRQLRQMALLFFVLGIVTVALAIYTHSKGA